MTIVSSVITAQNVQHDGRTWVQELHTDQLGVTYPIVYLAGATDNLAANMATHATNLWSSLQQAEITNNINAISTLGRYAVPTENYSTTPQNSAALVAWWPTALYLPAIMACDYINTLSDAVLEAVFGFTPTQAASIRATYLAPGATTAAAVRAATGV